MIDQPPPNHCLAFENPIRMRFHGGPWDGLYVWRKRAPKWIQLIPEQHHHPGVDYAEQEDVDAVQTLPLFEPPTDQQRARWPTYERRTTPEGPIEYDHMP